MAETVRWTPRPDARGDRNPEVGAGQVTVDVTFANITFIDTRIRAGTALFPVQLRTAVAPSRAAATPMILGNVSVV